MSRLHFSSIDAWLLLMVVIWGANFPVLKWAIAEVPPAPFNALRMTLAAAALLAVAWMRDRLRVPRADWLWFALLGFVGNFVYQLLFISGLHRTSAASTALIFGVTPVAVGLLSAALGHERVGPRRWAGAVLSVAGISLVIARPAIGCGADSIGGDALIFASMACWTIYTVAARPLLRRSSPIMLTAGTMTVGSLGLLVTSAPQLAALDYARISGWAWGALAYSALLSLGAAYVIWYAAVAQIGSSRTAVYSNVTPLMAMLIAWAGFGELIHPQQLAGAALILIAVALSKLGPSTPLPPAPAE